MSITCFEGYGDGTWMCGLEKDASRRPKTLNYTLRVLT